MLSIKPSKRLLVVLVIGAGLVCVVSGLGYWNRASALGKVQAQVNEKQDALANSEKTAKRLDRVAAEYTDAQMKLACLEQGVSTRAYVPTLLRQVEELGKNVSLRVVGVRPRPAPPPAPVTAADGDKDKPKAEPKPEPYAKLDMDLEINGKYWDVVRFLYKITSFPKIVAVNDLQASPAGLSNQPELGSPVLSVKLNCTAFILKDEPWKKSERPDGPKEAGRST